MTLLTSNLEVLAFLRSVLVEIKDIEEDEIRPESTLEEVALDSLDYVEVQLAIKKRYGVVVNQAALADGSILTIADFCSSVSDAVQALRPA